MRYSAASRCCAPGHGATPVRPSARGVRKGFTLIELMLVFCLVGIVMAVAIRSVGDTIRRDRVNKAMAILSADMEQAFAVAARQRTPMRLLFDSTRMTFSVAQRSDTTLKYRVRQFKTGDLALDYMSISRTTLDIMPSGLSADTLSLRLGIYSKSNSLYDRTLRMSRGGMVRIK
ncbi:MAG: prepilin-type N-terminal cleavage/methylation domain-containing protein [Vicinamibacterales bacterium]